MRNFTNSKEQIKRDTKELAKIAKYHLRVDDEKFSKLMNTGRDIFSQIQINVDVLQVMRIDGRFSKFSSKRNDIESMIEDYYDLKLEILKDLNKAHNGLSYQLTFQKINDNI